MIVHDVLRFVRKTYEQAEEASSSDYNDGFLGALSLVEDRILEIMWEEGVDDQEG